MESDHWIWQDQYKHPVPWDANYAPKPAHALLLESAERTPHASAIDFFGRKYSYDEVRGGALRVACGLQRMGLQPGDRVGLFLPNVPHYVAAYYGIMLAGGIAVNFSPLYTVDELSHQVEDSGTRFLFTLSAKALLPNAIRVLDSCRLERLIVGSIAGALPAGKSIMYRLFKRADVVERPDDPRISAFSALIDNDGACSLPDCDPVNDVALLQYTGGTTGRPKGAMLTHQNLTANARQVLGTDPDRTQPDRILGILPFFHVFANTVVLNRTIANGGEIVMLPRFEAAQALAALQRSRATSLPGVPTMYQALLDHPDLPKTDFSSLRVCISGGAPLPSVVREKFEAATGSVVVEGYGLTETSGVVSVNPFAGPNRGGTIGQPVPATRVKLVDKSDPTRPPPDGEPGEIVVAGPQIMRGYWQRPDADAEVFVDGYMRTGDVGVIEDDGYIRIVDRLKDMISVGGFKVFPSQLEDVLYRHPAVKETLVIGIPDDYLGERPKAFVTLQDEVDPISGETLLAWLNPQLGKHERVVAVEVRDSLPKTLVGKLSRKELVAEEKAKHAART